MKELRILRDGWQENQKIETQLLQNLTVQESLAEWLHLQAAFERQLVETAGLFEPDRRKAMIVLQARLRRLSSSQDR